MINRDPVTSSPHRMSTPSSIDLVVNGEARTCPAGSRVTDLLVMLGMAGRKVAVERNGEIVPRGLHPDTVLAAGDRLEIVVAVGGG
jgi:sulfur carrier protein